MLHNIKIRSVRMMIMMMMMKDE